MNSFCLRSSKGSYAFLLLLLLFLCVYDCEGKAGSNGCAVVAISVGPKPKGSISQNEAMDIWKLLEIQCFSCRYESNWFYCLR